MIRRKVSRHNLARLAVAVCLICCVFGCAARKAIPPLSAELSIDTATIVASRDGAYYFINFALSPGIPEKVNARIDYQRLSNPLKKQTLDLGSLADSRNVTFKSKPDRTIHGDHLYRLTIRLYDNSALIAERQVTILPNISTNIATLMDIRLL